MPPLRYRGLRGARRETGSTRDARRRGYRREAFHGGSTPRRATRTGARTERSRSATAHRRGDRRGARSGCSRRLRPERVGDGPTTPAVHDPHARQSSPAGSREPGAKVSARWSAPQREQVIPRRGIRGHRQPPAMLPQHFGTSVRVRRRTDVPKAGTGPGQGRMCPASVKRPYHSSRVSGIVGAGGRLPHPLGLRGAEDDLHVRGVPGDPGDRDAGRRHAVLRGELVETRRSAPGSSRGRRGRRRRRSPSGRATRPAA